MISYRSLLLSTIVLNDICVCVRVRVRVRVHVHVRVCVCVIRFVKIDPNHTGTQEKDTSTNFRL